MRKVLAILTLSYLLFVVGCASEVQKQDAAAITDPVTKIGDHTYKLAQGADADSKSTLDAVLKLESQTTGVDATKPASTLAPQAHVAVADAQKVKADTNSLVEATGGLQKEVSTLKNDVLALEIKNEKTGKKEVESGFVYKIGTVVSWTLFFLVISGVLVVLYETGIIPAIATKYPTLSWIVWPFHFGGQLLSYLGVAWEWIVSFIWHLFVRKHGSSSGSSHHSAS